jgi:tRNA-Thr(GGU) m(6)t(6)A37 methyltransferase TsaA
MILLEIVARLSLSLCYRQPIRQHFLPKQEENSMPTNNNAFQMTPIGYARGPEGGYRIEILAAYRPALKNLEHFSHLHLFWWASEHDNEKDRQTLVEPLPYADGIEAGVFACRSPARPNPMAVSLCPIIDVEKEAGIVRVAYFDAFDNTPVLDLKPYIPVNDRVKTVQVPQWFETWPDWYEDGEEFFSEYSFE